MDEINWLIIKELQLNARITMVELSKKTGLSSPSVSERIQRLEDAGIIVGYGAKINRKALGYQLSVYISIKLRFGMIKKFEAFIKTIPEICECHKLTGQECMLMKGYVKDTEHLELLNSKLAHFGELTTSLVLSSILTDKIMESAF